MILTAVDVENNLIDPGLEQPAQKIFPAAIEKGYPVGQKLTKDPFALDVPNNLGNLGMQRRFPADYADDLESSSVSQLIDLFLDEF
jgi:hypothetical protein